MDVEEYDDYGEIRPARKVRQHDAHRIHETKDMFDGDCYLCRKAMDDKLTTYWGEDG